MTTLKASHTGVNWHNHGAWLATMTETVALDGTHEEIRSLAYRLIEAADRAKANEWRKRAISAAKANNDQYVPEGQEYPGGDTSVEMAEAYLRPLGIDPDAIRGKA